MTPPNELQRLILHNAGFAPPVQIVAGISTRHRTARVAGAPHSIAEKLWHIVYWQDLFLRWSRSEAVKYPAHALEGWREFEVLADTEWDELVRQFEAGIAEAGGLAGRTEIHPLRATLEEPEVSRSPLTLLELLINVAVHNAYHLGRIVQLRQMLNCWPPPGSGDTW